MKKFTFTFLFLCCIFWGAMAQSIITNGNFNADVSGWITFNNEGNQTFDAVTNSDFTGNCAHITITAGSADRTVVGDSWKLGVKWNVSFPKDAHYKLKFKAKANTNLKLVSMFQENFPDFASWGYREFDLTNTATQYEIVIEDEHQVGGIWSFVFNYGHLQTGDEIWIDDIELIQVAGGTNIVNGDFENDVKNFEGLIPGGWGIANAEPAVANSIIDTDNPISGSKSLRIESVQSSVDGWRYFVRWWCYPTIDKRYWLKFKAKGSTDISNLVVECIDDWPTRNNTLFYHTYNVTTEVKEYSFIGSPTTTEFDRYTLNFWTAMIPNGEKLWIDDVELFPFYYVTGTINDENGNPLANVNTGNGVLTDVDGFYALIVPENGTLSINPSLQGYSFDPPTYTFSDMKGDSIMDFNASVSTSMTHLQKPNIKIYPNPAVDVIQLSLGTGTQYIKASITNILGKQLLTKELSINNNKIDVSGLLPGVYFIKVTDSNLKQQVLRFVKK